MRSERDTKPLLASNPEQADPPPIPPPQAGEGAGSASGKFVHYNARTLGPAFAPKLSDVSAHTKASNRSGERPDDRPSRPKSHISSSNAGNVPTCFTRPCS